MKNILKLSIVDYIVVLILFCSFTGVAEWRRANPGRSDWLARDLSTHLGAEYDSIAQAIRAGRGFSDPFKVESGPTAWMPPVLPILTAAIYYVCDDDRSLVVSVVFLLQACVVFMTGVLITAVARAQGSPGIGYLSVLFAYSLEFYELFQKTHDSWLVLLVNNVTLLMLLSWKLERAWKSLITYGIWGGFAALCSPISGMIWAGCTAYKLLIATDTTEARPSLSSRLFRLALVAAISMSVVAPWAVRNRVVLGKWIPIKSNFIYEVWQSQCLDQDGVLDSVSAFQHPWVRDGGQRAEYLQKGELEFIESRRPAVVKSISADPVGYLERTANRFVAATLFYTPLTARESEMYSTVYCRVIHPLPFVAFLLLLAFGKLDRIICFAAAILILGLSTYILVSYYQRYATPLILPKALLLVCCLHQFSSYFHNARNSKAEDDSRSEQTAISNQRRGSEC